MSHRPCEGHELPLTDTEIRTPLPQHMVPPQPTDEFIRADQGGGVTALVFHDAWVVEIDVEAHVCAEELNVRRTADR